ncbi:MAG: phosphoribosylglycinamide formyltransferase [Flaviaesturariibacter sp.]|nr:phosphoribosylglycinamide formyltransferase [Flaviaesturariibacter sp.]
MQDSIEHRLGKNGEENVIKVAIFASGAGTNTKKIIHHFREHAFIKISLVVCNKQGAGVISIAQEADIPVLMIQKERFLADGYLTELRAAEIDFLVLAGFLWKVPAVLTAAYPNRIVNLHPALLPAYGGKGMYGANVHEAVINSGDSESGITIHYVDEHYDNGDIIFQATCPVLPTDTPETLAAKIHALEYQHFPAVVAEAINAWKSLQ